MEKAELPVELYCKVCGHKWTRRVDRLPQTCPRCKHYNWRETSWDPETDARPTVRQRS